MSQREQDVLAATEPAQRSPGGLTPAQVRMLRAMRSAGIVHTAANQPESPSRGAVALAAAGSAARDALPFVRSPRFQVPEAYQTAGTKAAEVGGYLLGSAPLALATGVGATVAAGAGAARLAASAPAASRVLGYLSSAAPQGATIGQRVARNLVQNVYQGLAFSIANAPLAELGEGESRAERFAKDAAAGVAIDATLGALFGPFARTIGPRVVDDMLNAEVAIDRELAQGLRGGVRDLRSTSRTRLPDRPTEPAGPSAAGYARQVEELFEAAAPTMPAYRVTPETPAALPPATSFFGRSQGEALPTDPASVLAAPVEPARIPSRTGGPILAGGETRPPGTVERIREPTTPLSPATPPAPVVRTRERPFPPELFPERAAAEAPAAAPSPRPRGPAATAGLSPEDERLAREYAELQGPMGTREERQLAAQRIRSTGPERRRAISRRAEELLEGRSEEDVLSGRFVFREPVESPAAPARGAEALQEPVAATPTAPLAPLRQKYAAAVKKLPIRVREVVDDVLDASNERELFAKASNLTTVRIPAEHRGLVEQVVLEAQRTFQGPKAAPAPRARAGAAEAPVGPARAATGTPIREPQPVAPPPGGATTTGGGPKLRANLLPPEQRVPERPTKQAEFGRRYEDMTEAERRAAVENQYVDRMTGLHNQGAWEAARPRVDADPELEVTRFDLRNFKAVNEAQGEEGGDEVLGIFADAMRSVAGELGIPARNLFRRGGDEFVIAHAKGLGERVTKLMRDEFPDFDVEGFTVGVRAGTGPTDEAAVKAVAAAKKAETGPAARAASTIGRVKLSSGAEVAEESVAALRGLQRALAKKGDLSLVRVARELEQLDDDALADAALAAWKAKDMDRFHLARAIVARRTGAVLALDDSLHELGVFGADVPTPKIPQALLDAEQAQMERLSRILERMAPPVRPVERAGPAPEVPLREGAEPGIAGRKTRAVFPGKGTKLQARYQLMPLRELTPSHDPTTFQPSGRYPEGVQGRHYETDRAAQQVVTEHTQQFDPARANDLSIGVEAGPPTVRPDGVAIAGNQRAMVLHRVQQLRPKAWEAYQDDLIERAVEFGLDPDEVTAAFIREPQVLVRVIDDPSVNLEDRATLARLNDESDAPATKAKDPMDEAASRARALSAAGPALRHFQATAEPEQSMRAYLATPSGAKFARQLVEDGVISKPEVARYMDTEGNVTEQGKELLESMMEVAAIGDVEVARRSPKAIRNKLDTSYSAIIQSRAVPGWDLGPELREALDILADRAELKARMGDKADVSTLAKFFDERARQTSIFEGPPRQYSERGMEMARVIAEDWKKAELKAAWETWAREAALSEQIAREGGGLFGWQAKTPEQVWKDVFEQPKRIRESKVPPCL